jgi:hypothetical protein
MNDETNQKAVPAKAVRSFQVKTVTDMLAKLDWELRQLLAAQVSISPLAMRVSSYFAINAAITAFHTADWIWAVASEEQRAAWIADVQTLKRARPKTRFQIMIKRKCSEFGLCREIANSSKHLEDDENTDKNVRTVEPWFISMPGVAGVLKAGDPISQHAAILMVAGKDGMVPAAHVFTRVHAFLEEFCQENGLICDVSQQMPD